ncbi:uncharacterized protein NECHADRAFT_86916 [Fusarium vanettenii 77-13-4]|uniref:Uncharacterized protein n=1 Tax=Fusarium vanettenii (strain ATCC MYA-4622 / CBS 123669 / FGSC 9596 / NRRL 45880 / 77-13-4) TaxID=660122 RepID=C7ZHZ4_FUSV7|nr:uncharacterized protein NECHADRAFT_86916 [Fusarium vanettenii 77-13-4]EEU36364.1 predicted protein [Fusarium vanettenii 77-13-4]
MAFIVCSASHLLLLVPGASLDKTKRPRFASLSPVRLFVSHRLEKKQRVEDESDQDEGVDIKDLLVDNESDTVGRADDLTPAEFEYYLTIKVCRQERFFYPYHVLPRSQAEAYGSLELVGYDRTLHATATPRKLMSAPMFWMIHYFCNKDQALKTQRS